MKRNWNIMSGWWRAVDFQRPPFNFPTPERLINEGTTAQFDKREKSLGLWRFDDLPLGQHSPLRARAAIRFGAGPTTRILMHR